LFRSLFSSPKLFSPKHTKADADSFQVDNCDQRDISPKRQPGSNAASFEVECDDVEKFLAAKAMSVDEGYDFVTSRMSDCRLTGYYPSYFYHNKVPLIRSELVIDSKRPTDKKRFATQHWASPTSVSSFSPIKIARQISKGVGLLS
jgi:hypothetical protein